MILDRRRRKRSPDLTVYTGTGLDGVEAPIGTPDPRGRPKTSRLPRPSVSRGTFEHHLRLSSPKPTDEGVDDGRRASRSDARNYQARSTLDAPDARRSRHEKQRSTLLLRALASRSNSKEQPSCCFRRLERRTRRNEGQPKEGCADPKQAKSCSASRSPACDLKA
ncbi:hypothetical protein MA16_Dca001778 [Dendrobium catenatum]|uniref:Uncharacterized protein n=1 Tax=Dendrobium catenatum TaxID=906689 RepID=A0A2I0XDE6_9ASPA|nr:hypothetical protein MA16_Dca001778 [Dendrobium catenatum]